MFSRHNLVKLLHENTPGRSLVFAIRRMFERSVTKSDIREVLEHGERIEDYPDDAPHGSALVLGWCGSRPLHVVAAENVAEDETIVITVYEPDPDLWERDFKKRKRRKGKR